MQESSVSVHLQTWQPATRPAIPPPPPIPLAAVRAEVEAARLRGISRFARGERAAARESAAADATAYVNAESQRVRQVHEALGSEADAWWQSLRDNDESAVIEVANSAFADNPAAGCAVGVADSTLSVVMRQQDLDSLPEQTVGVDRSGRPSLKALPKREAVAWWLHILASNLTATIREALAVAPGITRVSVAVITRFPADRRLGIVAFGSWSRREIEAASWRTSDDALRIFDLGRDVQCSVRLTASGNYSTALKPLPLDDTPELSQLVASAEDLDSDNTLALLDSELSSPMPGWTGPAFGADPYALTSIPRWLGDHHRSPDEFLRPESHLAANQPSETVDEVRLVAGENIQLPDIGAAKLECASSTRGGLEADLSVLLVDAAGRVRSDQDFVFYNQPADPSGIATLMGKSSRPDRSVESAVVRPRAAPTEVDRLLLVLSVDSSHGATLVDAGIDISIACPGHTWRFSPPPAPVGAMVLAEVYRRTGSWKLRALGQGWSDGLAGLARDHGVDVEN